MDKKQIAFLLILGILALIATLLAVFFVIKNRGINAVNLEAMYPDCNLAEACGDLVGVNCHAEVDGPYYYVKKNNGEIVSTCGGACMIGDCTNCPPKEWTCE